MDVISQSCIDVLTDLKSSNILLMGYISDSNTFLQDIHKNIKEASRDRDIGSMVALLKIKHNKGFIRQQAESFIRLISIEMEKSKKNIAAAEKTLQFLINSNESQIALDPNLSAIIAINKLKLQTLNQQIDLAVKQMATLESVKAFKTFHLNEAVHTFEALENRELDTEFIYESLLCKIRQNKTLSSIAYNAIVVLAGLSAALLCYLVIATEVTSASNSIYRFYVEPMQSKYNATRSIFTMFMITALVCVTVKTAQKLKKQAIIGKIKNKELCLPAGLLLIILSIGLLVSIKVRHNSIVSSIHETIKNTPIDHSATNIVATIYIEPTSLTVHPLIISLISLIATIYINQRQLKKNREMLGYLREVDLIKDAQEKKND